MALTTDKLMGDGAGPDYARPVAMLLAGESFLSAAQDSSKPQDLRTELEKAGCKLLAKSVDLALKLT
jgi:hypothetical protein